MKKEKEEANKVVRMEDLFEEIGAYGKFQKIFTILAMYPQLVSAMVIFSPVFTGTDNVPMFCTNPEAFLTEYNCVKNCTVPSNATVIRSVVQEWNLICSRRWVVDTINSCQMIGMMLGAMVSSLIAERYGRRVGYFVVTIAIGVFGILPALTFSPEAYAVTRFLAGFGDGGTFVVYLVHLTEFLTPSWRSLCGAIPFWCAGEMLLGLLAYLIPNWRYLTVATAAPAFVVLLFFPYLQESPRWLLTRKRTEEAAEILNKIAKWNSKPALEPAMIQALQDSVTAEDSKAIKGFEGLKQVWQSKTLCIHLALLTWIKVACAIVYYGLSFSAKNLSGNPYLNIVYMALLDLVATLLIPISCNKIGRKKTIAMSMIFAAAFLLLALVLHLISYIPQNLPLLITAMVLIGRFGVAFCYGSLRLATLESFPTTLRSSCMGFTTLVSYFGGILAPQATFLGYISPVIPYLIFCFLTVSGSICALFLRDMTGNPLTDVVD